MKGLGELGFDAHRHPAQEVAVRHEATPQPGAYTEAVCGDANDSAGKLTHTFGMAEVAARGGVTEDRMRTHIRKCLSKKGRLLWHRVFRQRGEGDAKAQRSNMLPVKLEICSGNGDWVVAQARADAGRANWVALELKVNPGRSRILEFLIVLCIL
jgi:hypothetical protein